MQNYEVEIWFDQIPEKIKLGSVVVFAESETEALDLAVKRTEHWVIGSVGHHKWKIKLRPRAKQ